MTPTREQQRAEELMAKGPVWLVRRVLELEQREKGLRAALFELICAIGEWFSGDMPPQLCNDARVRTAVGLAALDDTPAAATAASSEESDD